MLPKTQQIFLATTALEDFWDRNKPIVFLGEWCLLYERRSYWEGLNGQLLRSPYDHSEQVKNAYDYVMEVYETTLPVLAEKLNEIHGEDYSDRYWRIVLGPWLNLYLFVVYDRLKCLKQAANEFKNFTTIGLSTESYVIPADTLDFVCFSSEDSYNLQLCTKILHALGKEFPCKKHDITQNPLVTKLLRNSWVRQGISKIMQVLNVILARRQSTIFLINSYFSKKIELRLLVRSFGRLVTNWQKPMPSLTFEYDSGKRNILRSAPLGCSEFEKCLSAMLYADIPQCFVEGFSSLKNSAIKRFPRHSSAIFSATGWYYDEAFKHWAAESAQFGTLLLGTQHGGNYGVLDRMANEAHETSIVNIYYSWGWERKDCYAKVVPMPATKLLERNEIGADSRKNNILWAATHAPRYSVGLPRIPGHFSEYLSWQIRFAKALPKSITEVVCFRPHQEEYSWGISRRLKDCIPEIRFDPCSVPFQNSLSNCRLYVCDHLSTTFIEALAVNKPTILFWNPVDNELRPEAKVYFDLLVDCGVLFDTPEAAATAVTVAYDDVVTWWNESRRQEAVRKFRDRFARTSPNGVLTWYGELTKLINLSSPL